VRLERDRRKLGALASENGVALQFQVRCSSLAALARHSTVVREQLLACRNTDVLAGVSLPMLESLSGTCLARHTVPALEYLE
jgi:hypothetical protein